MVKYQRDRQLKFVCRVGVLWCLMVWFVCLKHTYIHSRRQHDRTLEMVFGSQTVNQDKEVDNSHLQRYPETEQWRNR
ncbi:hypothetical protein B5F34_14035 [Mediterranea sp. An20]|nr:hypothetical protein B5F34_14035 [Mediterranea sp. An20]